MCHVGIDDDELRIDLMNQFSYFLPHLLALSCSSPFWEAQDTGLKSYRLTVFDAVPRTGLPERFDSYAEYDRHIGVLVDAGLIPDATMIWWDLRPSARYPTPGIAHHGCVHGHAGCVVPHSVDRVHIANAVPVAHQQSALAHCIPG